MRKNPEDYGIKLREPTNAFPWEFLNPKVSRKAMKSEIPMWLAQASPIPVCLRCVEEMI